MEYEDDPWAWMWCRILAQLGLYEMNGFAGESTEVEGGGWA